MMGNMILNKRRDKEIAVVVTGLVTERQRVFGILTGLLQ